MPGPWVKDWSTYEALRKEGKSKASAARIANAQAAKKKRKKKLRFNKSAMRSGAVRASLKYNPGDSDSDYA